MLFLADERQHSVRVDLRQHAQSCQRDSPPHATGHIRPEVVSPTEACLGLGEKRVKRKGRIINLIECTNPLVISILNGIIPKDVLVKLNAGDTKGAIESINCTKTDENNLIMI